jgi:transketolase
MTVSFGPRRGVWSKIGREGADTPPPDVPPLNLLDQLYRSLCSMLYNYVPTSGHPGGSISSGRFVASLLFGPMDYDVSRPSRDDADVLSFAAGHKAMGLYAMWALRNEMLRVAAPELLPEDEAQQLRLEDLLGFRRNPKTATPLFRSLRAKALDGHPTPATPFVRLSTGASGVGLASSLGLALAALDTYGSGDDAPRVHVVEGEGGLTPGRVSEALAFAGSAGLENAVVHVDWNQASIDSDHVTREDGTPGDYVQWTPMELFHLHDWNVVEVPDGMSWSSIGRAQREALEIGNGQPTAIVYRTKKGFEYGIEGRASHGAGHRMCSAEFFASLQPAVRRSNLAMPTCEPAGTRCAAGRNAEVLEQCFWDSLGIVRGIIEGNPRVAQALARRLVSSRERLDRRQRMPRKGAPSVGRVYEAARNAEVPAELVLTPGSETTLRGQLGKVLGHFNRLSEGAFFIAAADLLGSTSVSEGAKGFPGGFFHAKINAGARLLSVGGICEDAISGVLSGLSSFGRHIGVGSSYGAFLAPLGHIASRLHAIGCQARESVTGDPYRPMILVCAHAGLKTGEDGPTHADPQPLQLLEENFPPRTMVTLTPWEPQEIYPLVAAALEARPAVIAPFVTRPEEKVLDRAALGLAPASDAAQGLYLLRASRGVPQGVVILQESAAAYAFVEEALPLLEKDGIDVEVYYVASAELWDRQPQALREAVFPESRAQVAMGITGFTLPTLYRWVRSDFGRAHSLHPYQHGRFPGSGQGSAVIAEAGLDGGSQHRAIVKYVEELRTWTDEGQPLAPSWRVPADRATASRR